MPDSRGQVDFRLSAQCTAAEPKTPDFLLPTPELPQTTLDCGPGMDKDNTSPQQNKSSKAVIHHMYADTLSCLYKQTKRTHAYTVIHANAYNLWPPCGHPQPPLVTSRNIRHATQLRTANGAYHKNRPPPAHRKGSAATTCAATSTIQLTMLSTNCYYHTYINSHRRENG